MWKLWDFNCNNCNLTFEELSKDETADCPECGDSITRSKVCVGKFGTFSIMDADRQRQELLRRSAAHTLGEVRREPEKFGQIGIDRARAGQIRSFGGIKND